MFDTNILLKCIEIIHEYLMQFRWIGVGWGGVGDLRFVCLSVCVCDCIHSITNQQMGTQRV